MELWICGKVQIVYSKKSVVWDIQGIFDTEEQAIKACKTKKYFVGPIKLNEELAEKPVKWPGLYFPMLNANYKQPEALCKRINADQYKLWCANHYKF